MTWWHWLSGKKTVIGSVLLWLAQIAIPFVMQTFSLDLPWMAQVVSIMTWIAGLLIPVGVTHKAIKKNQ